MNIHFYCLAHAFIIVVRCFPKLNLLHRTDLQTLKLENDNLLMEKSELALRLSQAKGDALEKEVRLTNELQRARQEMRQKEDMAKIQLDEISKASATANSIMEVYSKYRCALVPYYIT